MLARPACGAWGNAGMQQGSMCTPCPPVIIVVVWHWEEGDVECARLPATFVLCSLWRCWHPYKRRDAELRDEEGLCAGNCLVVALIHIIHTDIIMVLPVQCEELRDGSIQSSAAKPLGKAWSK